MKKNKKDKDDLKKKLNALTNDKLLEDKELERLKKKLKELEDKDKNKL